MKKLITIALMLGLWSCEKEDLARPVLNQTKDTVRVFSIGQEHEGGIIFYIDSTGQHGFISSKSDQGDGIKWSCGLKETPGGTKKEAGCGRLNTMAIMGANDTTCGTTILAAHIADRMVVQSFDDWYLPSIDELKLMYLQKYTIGGFVAGAYWSSNEFDKERAYGVVLTNGIETINNKSNPANIRCIRNF